MGRQTRVVITKEFYKDGCKSQLRTPMKGGGKLKTIGVGQYTRMGIKKY